MNNQIFAWQKPDYLKLSSLNELLPPAVLIHGSKGLAKRVLALAWITNILCHSPNLGMACGTCQSCVLLGEQSHPDFLYLKDENEDEGKKTKNITVAQTAKVVEFLSLSPHLAKHKIVFIEDVALLGIGSANSLLKILEEPPKSALFVLVSDNLTQVLPTIVSRCHKFQAQKPRGDIEVRSEIYNFEFWLKYYDGAPCFELELSEAAFDVLIKTLAKPSISNIYSLTKEIDGKMVSFDFFVKFLSKWLSDLLSFKLRGGLNYFIDYQDKIEPLLVRVNLEKAFALNDDLSFLHRFTNHPLNHKLQIENLLFKYQQIFG